MTLRGVTNEEQPRSNANGRGSGTLAMAGRRALTESVLDAAKKGSEEGLRLLGCALVWEWMGAKEGR
jgi:hypothetical protein